MDKWRMETSKKPRKERRGRVNKLAFVDLETTGLFPYRHGVWQIGLILAELGPTRTLTITGRHKWEMGPHEGDVIDGKALKVGGITEEDLSEFPEPMQVFGELSTILDGTVDKYDKKDKMFFLAYNSTFDEGFLRSWFKKCGSNFFGSYFHHPDICVMRLAHQAVAMGNLLWNRGEMKNFKLGTVANELGVAVNEEDLHDALVDVDLTMRMYVKLCGLTIVGDVVQNQGEE